MRGMLRVAVDLVAAASAEINAIRRAGFSVERKEDLTPVTAADLAAERIIVQGLRAHFPDIAVIAEEEVAAGRITAPASVFWLVDPLDGTREFAAGRDEFAVNIGLVVDGVAVLGAVGTPAFGAIYAGIVGVGAWKHDAAGVRPIAVRAAPAEGLHVMASRHYEHDPKLAALLAGLRVAAVTNIGSAVKFCRVAEGVADYYPRLGRTMEWDTAAPQAVVEAAGGSVLNFAGVPLRYGKAEWENPDFICRGSMLNAWHDRRCEQP